MKTLQKITIHIFALWALIGVVASGQTPNPIPAQALGTLKVPKTLDEMVLPAARSINLIEGREFLFPQGAAVDTSATEPILYVADTGNRRVLGFKNPGLQWALQSADIVIGQRDMTSSFPNTPGLGSPSYGSGLNRPTSVAVDRQGNLFVLDYTNHRILRYPKPAEQTGLITADLVIGQPNLNSRNPNQSTAANAAPRADTLRFGTGFPGVEFAALAFDPEGNLWVTDNGNHRVLRYPAAEVSGASNTSTTGQRVISADYVLGQTDFRTATANPARIASSSTDIVNKLKLRYGSALAFDSQGNLYVADDLGRVLYWRRGFSADSLGRAADRILGLYVLQQGETVSTNDFLLAGGTFGQNFAYGPKGLTVIDDRLYVSDTLSHRVVYFPRPSEWPGETQASPSPRMAGVFGQPDFFASRVNRGAPEPASDTLSFPAGLAYHPAAREIYVVDTGNNRVLVHPYDPGSVAPARAVLGQTGFEFRAPNFIEGREFGNGEVTFTTSSGSASVPIGPHAAIDYTSNPPRLYVADPLNNRILGYADARRVSAGAKADLVIGQVDFYRSLVNSPSNNAQTPTETGFNSPAAVAVDSEGHLYVADTDNGRVLRFPRPFDQPEGLQRADLVIGQRDFTSRDRQVVNERTLRAPVSLAFTGNDSLVVADIAAHRVLLFARGDFANGMHATRVIGQLDFTSAEAGNAENRLALPLQISVDADDNLFVADYGNNRIQVFYRVSAVAEGNGVDATNSIRLTGSALVGVAASKRKSQFWIVDGGTGTNPGRAIRIPDRDQFFLTGTLTPDITIQTASARAVVLDERDNPMIFDGLGRMTMHYPLLSVVNWANGFARVSPSMIGTLRVPGVRLEGSGTEINGPVVPLELDDLEVTVAGYKSPVIQVATDDARIIIPKLAPSTGNAEFLVRRPSTNEIVAHGFVNMTSVSPAFITEVPTAPLTPAIAFNEDGTKNSVGNRAKAGSTLTVYLTGYGYFEGLPEDGMAAAVDVPTAGSLRVLLFTAGNLATEATSIVSSTLDPDRPGVWKLSVKVPDNIPATGDYWIGVNYKNTNSYLTPVNPTPAGQVRPVVFLTR